MAYFRSRSSFCSRYELRTLLAFFLPMLYWVLLGLFCCIRLLSRFLSTVMLTELGFEPFKPKDCWWEVDFCWALKLWLLGLI